VQVLRDGDHVVQLLGTAVVLLAVVTGVGVDFLGELLFHTYSGDDNRREVGELEQVAQFDVVEGPGISGDQVDVET